MNQLGQVLDDYNRLTDDFSRGSGYVERFSENSNLGYKCYLGKSMDGFLQRSGRRIFQHVEKQGYPRGRIVILKEFSERFHGFNSLLGHLQRNFRVSNG